MALIVLVAPAAFKGTLSSGRVAEAVAAGVRRALPDASILLCPVADGGDGLLDVVLPPGALRERVEVTGPLGQPVAAELGWMDAGTAILESAQACGLALLRPEHRDPLRATSRGVGELIRVAVDRGAAALVVGLGGTATVDGGTGAARALGWTFRDSAGRPLPEGGGSLVELADVGGGSVLKARVIALTDVTSPLVGPQGAALVFAPQKGAKPQDVARLAAGLDRLAAVLAEHGRPELATVPGGGAAGGLGAGLAFFAKAQLVPGAEWVLSRAGFDGALARADLVITGEGVFDRTSLAGKATGEVLTRARNARKTVAVVAGRVDSPTSVPALGGAGQMLDEADIAGLAERVTREAFRLPLP